VNSRNLVPVLLLFAGSGCAALIYEVVWYQQLQLVLGSTTVSLAILLATFMGGLCLGSLALPRFRFDGRHPLQVFAGVEFAIALCGLLVKFLLPVVSRAYFDGASIGLLAALLMLPATFFMGASFPAIARWVRGEASSSWALLYGCNTAGAVLGCLLAGFFLLRVYDMATAAWVACGVNLAVAGLSWFVGRGSNEAVSPEAAPEPSEGVGAPLWAIYLTIGLSGFCALGAEVIWTRLLSMLFLGTVYIFSAILAVFLIGLAIGGALSSRLTRRGADPAQALGLCQLLLCAGIAYTAVMIATVLPEWSRIVLAITDPWHTLRTDLQFAAAAILPPAILWGASFPLACAAALRSKSDDPARVTGRVYAANTLGAIAGALLVSLLLVPHIGSQESQRLLLAISALSVFPVVMKAKARKAMMVGAALALVLWAAIPAVPSDLIAYGRNMADMRGRSELLWMNEGLNSSVAYTRWPNNTTYINVNGHVEATSEDYDMRLQRMVGHLPLLIHGNAKSVLGIGFGAGVSAGTFTRYPTVEHITVCEIEPLIPPHSNQFFGPQNYHVYQDKRTRIVYDDARHYLMTTKDKYDVIASDPLDVFIKGTAALYTAEYFEAVKKRLNPGGYFSLYVPLYETDEPTIKSELETFFRVFPNATVWSNTREGQGYDLVFLGQAEPFQVNLDVVEQRLESPAYAPVLQSLQDIGMNNAADLFGTYLGGAAGLHPWTAGAQINSDGDLRLSYLAGLGVNAAMANDHYVHMLRYRRDYLGLFEGSPAAKRALQDAVYKQTP
jgi:spermidine synthase